MPERTYRAICFDLDGTLLPQELESFLSSYFAALARSMVKQGAPLEAFKTALNAGTKSMVLHEGGCTNEEAYWETFMQVMTGLAPDDQRPRAEWETLLNAFYENEFGLVGADVVPDQHMVDAVAALKAKGYPLMLTTMPLFPRRAVEWRLNWAGLRAEDFSRLTTYDNSTAAKPKLTYYAENLAAMGLSGADVLIVGNNTVEDLAFTRLGADAYLVTNHLLDPIDLDLSSVRHGDSVEFLAWVRQLPDCADPVQDVLLGVVDAAAAAEALQANLTCTPEELAAAAEQEARAHGAADDIGNAIAGEAADRTSAEATNQPSAAEASQGYRPIGMGKLDDFSEKGDK